MTADMSARANQKRSVDRARAAKKDEFYTQLADIERELVHYRAHFRGKTVLCNCDDPRVSNFFNYFSRNFEFLQLKKLITTCYKNQERDMFSRHDSERAISLEYNGDLNQNRIPDPEEIGIKLINVSYEDYATASDHKEGMIRVSGVHWFTNLDHEKHHKDMILYRTYNPDDYPKYDNYDAINVDKTKDIPVDYAGVMGVPITFLDKHNPDQFEIVKFRKGDDDKDLTVGGKYPYMRILIRNKRVQK